MAARSWGRCSASSGSPWKAGSGNWGEARPALARGRQPGGEALSPGGLTLGAPAHLGRRSAEEECVHTGSLRAGRRAWPRGHCLRFSPGRLGQGEAALLATGTAVALSPNSVSGPRGQPEEPSRSPGWFWSPTQGAERKRPLLYAGSSFLIENVRILGAGKSLVSLREDATGHRPDQP